MKVEVALFATLSEYLPPGAQNRRAVIEVQDGATVCEVMNYLDIPPHLPKILLVNGRQAPDTTVLKEGQTLSLFPPLAGGCASGSSPSAGRRSGADPPFERTRSAPGPLICPPEPSSTTRPRRI